MKTNRYMLLAASLLASGVMAAPAAPSNWYTDPSFELIRGFESSFGSNTNLKKQFQAQVITASPIDWQHATFSLLYVILGGEQYLQENNCQRAAKNEISAEKYNLNCEEIQGKGVWVEAKSLTEVKYVEMVWVVEGGKLGTVTIRSNPIRSNYEAPVYDATPRKVLNRYIDLDEPETGSKVFQLDFKEAIEFAKKYDGLKSFSSIALLPRASGDTNDAQTYYSFQSAVEDKFHSNDNHEAAKHDVWSVIGQGSDLKPCLNNQCWKYAQYMYHLSTQKWVRPDEIIEELMIKDKLPTFKDFEI